MSAQGTPTTRRGQAEGALEAIDASRTFRELERAFLYAAPRQIELDGYGICWVDGAQRTTSVQSRNVPADLVSEYERFGRGNDALFCYMVDHDRPVHDRLLFGQRQWKRQPVSRFISNWGFERCMQAPVIVDSQLRSTLHFLRNPGARPFTEPDLRAANALHQRVRQQLRLILAERELERTREMCSSLLEHIPVPAVITTRSAALVHVNHAADLMLVTYRGKPALWREYAAAVTRNATAIAVGEDGGEGAFAARRDCADPGYVVRTRRVERGDLFISLFQPRGETRGDWSLLCPREQVVANLVAQGYTNARIAQTLSVSINTVKEHLKRINRKLGTANRAQVAACAQAQLGGR